jgi:hypothetical protein
MNQNPNAPSLEGLIAVLADIVRDQKLKELEGKRNKPNKPKAT